MQKNDHDHSYKLLFSHSHMVEDLLQGLVHTVNAIEDVFDD